MTNKNNIAIVTTLGAQEFDKTVVHAVSEQVKEKVASGLAEGEIVVADTTFKFKKEAKDVLLSMASET
ncbi:hypothetical protein [Sulfitobacter sp. R18_1]|uniref:hypothetical protein n=1 Tax=Sulfitobacter sp. R18_1 TaxID=2821104 RepID=UPI001ADA4032|nr:hypothetical protein [Sulfitobacter sp. R18_1]MBO9427968.1 hypothetical protein [Sulfitobacter sp. R18_1]